MEALQRQHWSISIEAKANGVGFKLKLYRILHCSRLSFLLRIPRSRFSLNFKLRTTLSACERIGKSSSSRLFGRLCRWKSRSIAKKKDVLFVKRSKLGKPEWSAFRFPFQDPVAAMMGSLSLLFYSASKRDHGGIVIHGLTFIFFLMILLRFKMKKIHFSLVLAITIISTIGISCVCMSYQDCFTVTARKSGMNFISAGCLFALSQLVKPTDLRPVGFYASSVKFLMKRKQDMHMMLREVCSGFKRSFIGHLKIQ
ncbi:uncharacterized protein LOC120273476 [Dioscorea cayenensis subsp. rotundata]|uniref:Uncharacterized protein LOC120273476 n=1 Tax=Dioscorea cayennensis subsp. rotundata TaxID=55577 RepID=A0AB40C857_DIOCR|nr:uncharacterized protein LOC120273476 [Dioscorea cayenensis subsp. rotundata]XP_039136036.1 uncharacterized protein LOC120273476 [Dioscorea cayenensis subsp. rotundata]